MEKRVRIAELQRSRTDTEGFEESASAKRYE